MNEVNKQKSYPYNLNCIDKKCIILIPSKKIKNNCKIYSSKKNCKIYSSKINFKIEHINI